VAAVLAAALTACASGVVVLHRADVPRRIDAWRVADVHDGFHRLLVTPSPDLLRQLDAGSRTGAGRGTARASRDAGRPARLDPALLARAQQVLGAEGALGLDDEGRLAWIVGARSLPVGAGAHQGVPQPYTGSTAPGSTASDGSGPARSGPADRAPDGSARSVDTVRAAAGWFAAQAWVHTAQPMRDGRVLVATSLAPAQVAGQPGVGAVAATATVPVASLSSPDDPYWRYAWHLQNTGSAYGQTAVAGADVGALSAWTRTTGVGAVVAVIDTGVDASHPDLAGALWTNPDEACGGTDTDHDGYAGDCHGWNFYANSADITNGSGGEHGTGVAGSIAARADNGIGASGLAPRAVVMPLVVGSGTTVNMALVNQAIYYAVDHGAKVINGSFGGSLDAASLAALENAVAYARSKGVLFVVAAGNDNANRDASPSYPASLTDANVVTVGASTAADTRASFSAWGASSVDLFAPGVNVVTTDLSGGYSLVSGTSIASPLVAAAAAMLARTDPSLTPQDLRTRLMSTADHPAGLAGLSVSGGRLSAARLLAGALTYQVDAGSGLLAGRAGSIAVTATGDAPAGSLAMKLTLAYRQNGRTWAVSGVPLTGADGEVTTGDDGSVTVPVTGSPTADGARAEVSLTLPAGQFALLSQLISDGAPVGRPAVAVLPVAAAAGAGSTPAPTSSSAPASSSAPTSSSAPAPGGGSAPTGSSSPSTSAGPTGAATTAPGGSGAPTGPSPSTPPSSGTGAGPAPSGTATSSPTATAAPTARATATATAAPTARATATATATSTATSAPAPAPSGFPVPAGSGDSGSGGTGSGGSGSGGSGGTTYPGTGAFGITSLTPNVVSTAGGDLVTLTGTALPTGVSVLVGGAPVTVLPGGSTTELVFRTNPSVAGRYDVAVYAVPGTASQILSGALTVQSAAGGTVPTASSAPTSSSGGSGGSGGSGTGGATSPSSSPSATATGAPTGTAAPSGPITAVGPGGLRLVASPELDGLTDPVWAAAVCAGTCTAIGL
jgi:subtilisin family serine protease